MRMKRTLEDPLERRVRPTQLERRERMIVRGVKVGIRVSRTLRKEGKTRVRIVDRREGMDLIVVEGTRIIITRRGRGIIMEEVGNLEMMEV